MTPDSPLRIGVVAPPMLPVPPPTYAGTERVVAALVDALVRCGHRVTLFAAGDSHVAAELVATRPKSLWSEGYRGDVSSFINVGLAQAWAQHERFDVIHSHVETLGFLFARHCPTPVVTTLHGRLDVSGIPELLEEFVDIPLVAISESQRRWAPDANWVGTIHHGLPLERVPYSTKPGSYLAFVGRITPEKGIADSIAVARRVKMPLRIAAKVYDPHEKEHFARVVEPAIGRRAGALTETVEHGVNGFLVDDLQEAELAVQQVTSLDRAQVRQFAIERFSPARMT